MSLTKSAIVTVIPAVIGQPGYTASLTCQAIPPPVDPGTTVQPPLGGGSSGGSGGIVVAAGTPIILEDRQPSGAYNTYSGVAPAPAGFVCRREMVFVYTPGSLTPAVRYNVVCSRG